MVAICNCRRVEASVLKSPGAFSQVSRLKTSILCHILLICDRVIDTRTQAHWFTDRKAQTLNWFLDCLLERSQRPVAQAPEKNMRDHLEDSLKLGAGSWKAGTSHTRTADRPQRTHTMHHARRSFVDFAWEGWGWSCGRPCIPSPDARCADASAE